MTIRKFNWLTWAGFLLCMLALISYPFFFVRWPVTRDFPWVNLLMFGVAAVLLFFGIRRAFASERRLKSKIAALVLATLSVAVVALFVSAFFIMGRSLPASHGAPHVGQKALEFTLADTRGRQVSLSELLSSPIEGKPASSPPKGVLLVFYRGYW
jgi:hypothetical protein